MPAFLQGKIKIAKYTGQYWACIKMGRPNSSVCGLICSFYSFEEDRTCNDPTHTDNYINYTCHKKSCLAKESLYSIKRGKKNNNKRYEKVHSYPIIYIDN